MPWLIGAIVLWSMANTSFKKDYKNGIIEADAKGYYAYLPAIFIYHDLNFGFFDSIENHIYYNQNLEYNYLRTINGKTVDKYYAGTALCLLPFFLAGHAITLATGLTADGYSYYYTFLVHLGALFYLMLGLFGLRKLMRTFVPDEKIIAFVLFAIVFGTNLFYYSATEFAMSHLYSFTAIAWFCYAVRKYFSDPKGKHLVYIALLLAVITLIRPVNLLVVLAVPFLAGSRESLVLEFRFMATQSVKLVWAIMCFLLVVTIQLVIYKISTGSFIVYSYTEEGFKFLHPQIWNFLFSYRKGMFVYTPLLLASLTGFVFIFRKNRFGFYALLAFLMVLIYVFSSWHMWFYGGSFSQRVMVEYYALFAVLLATTLYEIKNRKLKNLFISLVLLLIIFCQVQTYQYRRMQIHWSDMNKEKYWDVFLRVDKL